MGVEQRNRLRFRGCLIKVSPAVWFWCIAVFASCSFGCASLTNPVADAVPVREVPQECLCPPREHEITLPLNLLSLPADRIYRVSTGDVLGVWIEGILGPTNQVPPLHVSYVAPATSGDLLPAFPPA